MTTPDLPRADLEAALSARRELGPEYDAAFLEAVLERVDKTIESRIDTRHQDRRHFDNEAAKREHQLRVTTICVSLGVSVPLTAIALGTEQPWAVLVIWIGIVLVNMAHAIRRPR